MLEYNPDLPLFSIHIPKTAGTSFENVLQGWYNERYFPNLANRPRLRKIITPFNFDFFIQRALNCGLYFHYGNHYLNKPPRIIPLGKKYGLLNRRTRPECVHGHFEPISDNGNLFDFYPGASQFITFLRDPLDMHLSHFFYNKKLVERGQMYWRGEKIVEMKHDGDIDKWVEERGCHMLHFMALKFTIANYKEVVNSNFVHIGITEQMQKSVDILAAKLSFKTKAIPIENVTSRNLTPSDSSIKKFREKHELEYLIYNYAKTLNA